MGSGKGKARRAQNITKILDATPNEMIATLFGRGKNKSEIPFLVPEGMRVERSEQEYKFLLDKTIPQNSKFSVGDLVTEKGDPGTELKIVAARPQITVDLGNGKSVSLSVKGRLNVIVGGEEHIGTVTIAKDGKIEAVNLGVLYEARI